MKAGNMLMALLALALGGFVWMLADASSGSKGHSSGSPATLQSALASGQPVLLEFYADWCGPCKMVGPSVDELARELTGKAKVVRLNVDQNPALAQQYGVRSIPAFISLKGGREVGRETGAIDKGRMRQLLGL